MTERFVRKQVLRSGTINVRYGLPSHLLGSPSQEDIEKVKELRAREALAHLQNLLFEWPNETQETDEKLKRTTIPKDGQESLTLRLVQAVQESGLEAVNINDVDNVSTDRSITKE